MDANNGSPTVNLKLQMEAKQRIRKAKAKKARAKEGPRVRPLEHYAPLFQLRFAHRQAIFWPTRDVDINEFNNVPEILRLRLRIELVSLPNPSVPSVPNPNLEVLLDRIAVHHNFVPGNGNSVRGGLYYVDSMVYMANEADKTGLARTRLNGSNGNRSLSFYNNDRRDWSVDIENLLYRDEEYFGCIISNRKPIPGEPGTLLQGELECLMSLLRRRLDNRDDKGQSRETQRTLAPATVIVTLSPDERNEGLLLRVIRASFLSDAPERRRRLPGRRRTEDDVVLTVEVGETLRTAGSSDWTDKEKAVWAGKMRHVARLMIDPGIATADEERERAEAEVAMYRRYEDCLMQERLEQISVADDSEVETVDV